jgi:hypothetical protein
MSAGEHPDGRLVPRPRLGHRRVIAAAAVLLVLALLVAGWLVGIHRAGNDAKQGAAAEGATPVKVRSPLARATLPTRQVPYPASWPAALRFPRAFVLVRVRAGRVAGGGGYDAAMRRRGSSRAAADAVTTFFHRRGWRLVYRTALSSGGYALMVAGPVGRQSASVVIDRSSGGRPGASIVVAVLR